MIKAIKAAGTLFALLAGQFILAIPANAQSAEDDNIVVTMLGTGTPGLNPDRFGAANLVQAGGLNLLFDAGRGATVRLGQMGVPPGDVDAVFLTHFHSDHVNGLADVFLVGFIRGVTLGGRAEPFQLYGPVGTQRLADGISLAHQSDIEIRIEDEQIPEAGTQIQAYECTLTSEDECEAGVIFEENGVRVTIFPVLHGELVKPSVGYRIDYRGKSVVLSGDTTYDPILAEYGAGVDVLIHETGLGSEQAMQNPAIQRIIAHHTLPEDVGRIYTAAQPELAVMNHMVLLGNPPISEVVARVRSTYDGPFLIAEDLTQIVIADEGMTILKAGL